MVEKTKNFLTYILTSRVIVESPALEDFLITSCFSWMSIDYWSTCFFWSLPVSFCFSHSFFGLALFLLLTGYFLPRPSTFQGHFTKVPSPCKFLFYQYFFHSLFSDPFLHLCPSCINVVLPIIHNFLDLRGVDFK